MKTLVCLVMILFGSSAMAGTLFKCAIPNSTFVSLNIELQQDQSADFLVVSLNEKSAQSVFFSQLGKGEASEQVKNGYLQILALTEKSAQVDGVIKNTGFLALSQESATEFSGFMAANGNIYPLSCQK